MTLEEQIGRDYIAAYKAGNTVAKDALANLRAAITKWSKEPKNSGKNPTHGEVLTIIQSEAKKLNQTLSYITDPLNSKLASDTGGQLDVINQYLPQQLSEQEITGVIIGNLLEKLPDTMKFFKANYDGKYDNKLLKDTFDKVVKTRNTEL